MGTEKKTFTFVDCDVDDFDTLQPSVRISENDQLNLIT